MLKYIIKRILLAIPTFIGITVLVFVLSNMAPGSPVDVLASTNNLSEEAYEQLKVSLGLDKPVIVRYGDWLLNFVQGDLGTSTRTNTPVFGVIRERLGASLLLTVTSLLVCLLISIPLGVLSAVKQGSAWDTGANVLSFLGTSTPGFFLSLILVYFFAAKLGWLPATGMYEPNGAHTVGQLIRHMILPVFVMSFGMCGDFIKQTKGSMLEVYNNDYVKTARSKGLKNRVVIIKHVLRNALIPVVTMIALTVPFLLGGAVVTEQVFSWPGIGSLMVLSINSRDYNAIMGITVFIAAGVLICNLVLDLLYAKLDPRTGVETKGGN
jgi:peptide/nickel transport system permease protein